MASTRRFMMVPSKEDNDKTIWGRIWSAYEQIEREKGQVTRAELIDRSGVDDRVLRRIMKDYPMRKHKLRNLIFPKSPGRMPKSKTDPP